MMIAFFVNIVNGIVVILVENSKEFGIYTRKYFMTRYALAKCRKKKTKYKEINTNRINQHVLFCA